VFSRAQLTGFPARVGGEECWRDAERAQSNTEAMMLAVINALAIAIHEKEPGSALINIDWPNEFSLGN